MVLTLCAPLAAQAVPSEFDGLVQANSERLDSMTDKVFKRQEYDAAGASVSFEPWVWDPELGEHVYAVAPGESWTWRWLDAWTGEVLAYHTIRFEGGEDLCWDNGWCGAFTGWWAAAPLQCMPEDQRVRVEIYHDGLLLGADAFTPTRFVPRLDASLAGTLEPRRTRSGQGEATEVAVQVTDDLGCGQPLGGAVVRVTSTVKGGTNGQLYLAEGDRGTGRFSSLGYNAVLNPDTPNTHDTVIEGETDAQGVFKARYQAQAHGAEETIRFEVERPATPTNPELHGERIEKPLLIAIPDLVRITHENAPLAFADGGTCRHDPLPHWLTPRTRSRVMTLAAIYHLRTGRLLSLNDASLPLGGVLATGRVTVAQEHEDDEMPWCHGSHRQGIDIDINEYDRQVGDPGSERVGENIRIATTAERGRSMTLLRYLDEVAEELGGKPFHGNTSIHYRFSE